MGKRGPSAPSQRSAFSAGISALLGVGLRASLSESRPGWLSRGSPIWPALPGSGRGRRNSGVGVPEEDARSWRRGRAREAAGWGAGVGCALQLQSIPHPAQSRRSQLKSLPFQEEGREIKVPSPFLLKKSERRSGQLCGHSRSTPGPCTPASPRSATGEDSIS